MRLRRRQTHQRRDEMKKVVVSAVVAGIVAVGASAFDLGGALNATKNFVDNTADIASGKRQKEQEANKKAKEEADAKAQAEKDKIVARQNQYAAFCKKAYHQHKVPFGEDTREELTIFANQDTLMAYDGTVPEKFEKKTCYIFLSDYFNVFGGEEEFKKETAKYKK